MDLLWAGFGDLGHAALPALVARGHRVFGLRREPMEEPRRGLVPLRGDLHAPDGLAPLPPVQACIVTLTPDTRDLAGYERAYVHALANLHSLVEVQGSPSNPPLERLLFVSSTAVYGQHEAEWVAESASTSPSRFNGAVMLRAERLAQSARWPTTVARLAGIYGPGRDRLLRKVMEGRPSTDRWTNRIHRDDAAAAIVHLLGLTEAPPVVNVTDTEPATNREVLTWLAERMGQDAPPIEASGPVGGKRVDGSLLRRLGFQHAHPTFRDGYAALLETGA